MILEALTPIFTVILLGFLVSRTPISSAQVWEGLERLTYYLFFPALLINRLASTRMESEELLAIAYVLGFAFFVFSLLFTGLRQFISKDQPSWDRFIRAVFDSIPILVWRALKFFTVTMAWCSRPSAWWSTFLW